MEPFVFGHFSDLKVQPALGSIDSVRVQKSIDLLIENKVISSAPAASDLLDW
jgi:hypothetical protein